MNELIDLLSSDRVHIFGPRNFDTRLHLTYKMVRQSIQNGAQKVGFEIEPEKLIWQNQEETYEKVIDMANWKGDFVSSLRKILKYDEEVAKFFEVIEDSPKHIMCRIVKTTPSE